MKKFLEKFGYKVENESGKVDNKAIYVLFCFSLSYFVCSFANVITDCVSGTSPNYILEYAINLSIFLKVITYEFVRAMDVKKSMIPQNVVAGHRKVILVFRNKIAVCTGVLFLVMLILLIIARYEKIDIEEWELRGLCIYALIVSLIEDIFLFLEQKYKAQMVSFTITGG